ncbi:hypothetical protein [Halalkalibacter sp. APA_J-10(15)]|uniref:hypothetical protein n=1 Tax=Halalkalibacter sp. APA_J-10(15) TaxID=2933805 RepID=UPI001FF163A4|nr:hypothetical protein [Halalkalibacter sp. APA_J-10(15)]MCK0470275.1 hypothetical protein [Halalkalibacter sp. APA_J-10(15)]
MDKNKILWSEVEKLALQVLRESDIENKQLLFHEIYNLMERYIYRCSHNAQQRAKITNVYIPIEDFISTFNLSLWDCILAYSPERGSLVSLVSYRFRIAEATVWRNYEVKSDSSDKNNKNYSKGRWESLYYSNDEDTFNNKVDFLFSSISTEREYINMSLIDYISSFYKEHNRYGKIIYLLYQGFNGKDLAKVSGEDLTYSNKMRKLVQRSRDSFYHYLLANGYSF